MSVTVNTRMLKRLGACEAGIQRFREIFGSSITRKTKRGLIGALLKADEGGVDYVWLVRRFLSEGEKDELEAKRTSLPSRGAWLAVVFEKNQNKATRRLKQYHLDVLELYAETFWRKVAKKPKKLKRTKKS